jgi:hypothetical protein
MVFMDRTRLERHVETERPPVVPSELGRHNDGTV